MNFHAFKKYLKESGIPPFRTGQLFKAIYEKAVSSWNEATDIPLDLRAKLVKDFPILSIEPEQILKSEEAPVYKALFKLHDGKKIESVLMNSFKDSWSVCVSTQAGCPIGCMFCATGKAGFHRNLKQEEITDQVLFWLQYIKKHKLADRISGVVFMGMGEPFLNWAAVKGAVEELSDQQYFGIGRRHLSISTAGHADGIYRMAKELPQVNLALSLHSADPGLRDTLVPLNKKYPLEELKDALTDYIKKTGRKVFIEYTLIGGVNDGPKNVRLLIKWLKEFEQWKLFHVNIIECNPVEDGARHQYKPDAKAFANAITCAGINVTIRRSLGGDIAASCGQLAGKKAKIKTEKFKSDKPKP